MKKLVSLVLVCLLVLACTTAMAQQEPKKAVLVMRTLSDTFAATFANQLLTQAEVYKDTFTMEVLDAQG
ncbi:MAG: hypothetical protein RSD95_17135, partial [Clostridia bacterium]